MALLSHSVKCFCRHPRLPGRPVGHTKQRASIGILGKLTCWLLLAGLPLLPVAVHADPPTKDEMIVLFQRAMKHQDAAEYSEAERLYKEVLAEAPRLWGEDSTNYATVLNNLGNLYVDTKRYEKAEPLFLRSLQIREAKLGKDHTLVADSLNNLGNLYQYTRRYEKAESLFLRSLQIEEARLGKDHPDVAESLYNLANLYKEMGRYAKAEPFYLRSLQIDEAKLGKDHLHVARSLNNLANLYENMGRYEKAEPLIQRSLQITVAKLGKDHTLVADSLNNLGNLYLDTGRYEKAEPLYRRSLEIREAKLGEDHVLAASSLNNLANLYHAMGRDEKAEPLYLRSLNIREAKLGKDHPDVADSLNGLANLYETTGRYEKAEPLYQRSLQIYETSLGREHLRVALSLNNLALLYCFTGRYEKAEPLVVRSFGIKEARLGKDHPDVAQSLSLLAQLQAIRRGEVEAAQRYDASRRIMRRHIARVLPLLTEKEQLNFFRRTDASLHAALSLGYCYSRNAHLAQRSASWLLNAKGLAQQTLAAGPLTTRDSREPRLRQQIEQLLDLRRQLAHLTLTPARPGQEETRRQRLEVLTSQEQELATRLQQQGAAVEVADPWVHLDLLRGALPEGAAFIDIARFSVYDFQATGKQKRWQSARYVAWVTPRQGAVSVVDLGEAAKIDAAVAVARQALEDAPLLLKGARGEVAAEQHTRQALGALAALVLQPLQRHLEAVQEWVICPDGALWLAPWAALPLDAKTYAVEKHTLRLVVSGRDLLPRPSAAKDLSAPAIFADPDFDAAPSGSAGRLAGLSCPGSIGQRKLIFEFAQDGTLRIREGDGSGEIVGKGTWKAFGDEVTLRTQISRFSGRLEGDRVVGEREKRDAEGHVRRDRWEFRLPEDALAMQRTTRSLAGMQLGKVPRLPGTAAEAEAITEPLIEALGHKPTLWTEEKATTDAFLSLRRPRVLVLATHGFFLPDQELTALEREHAASDPNFKPRTRLEDPLLRCGLLLSGCNKGGEGDTGVLTGREVLSADLRGCQLVVLSACETGLGDVRNGEGVAGLRQAFLLAGAQSVLASLWKVPDDDTALLMASYFNRLARREGRAEALRQAQLQRIQQRRDKFGAAHPYFWAAFSLTGDGGPLHSDD